MGNRGEELIIVRPNELVSSLKHYQELALRTRKNASDWPYCLLYVQNGYVEEFGELIEKIWEWRKNPTGIPPALHQKIALEFGDIFWYLSMIAHDFNITFSDKNIDELSILLFELEKESETEDESELIAERVARTTIAQGKLYGFIKRLYRDREGFHERVVLEHDLEVLRGLIWDVTKELIFMANNFFIDVPYFLNANIGKLEKRLAENKIHGHGDIR